MEPKIKNIAGTICMLVAFAISYSCRQAAKPAEEETVAADVKTPVQVVKVSDTTMNDWIELNATSTFMQSSYVKANANGYVKMVNAKPGEFVQAGKPLFSVQTRESIALGNSISSLDSNFKFSGVNTIRASKSGYIVQLNHQAGDYVQDGEQLAVISDGGSFAFILNLPYELRPYVLNKKSVEITLPDGVQLPATIASVLPTVDSAAQTQQIVLHVNSKSPIPQNVIGKVRILKSSIPHAVVVPKQAVLSDESQTTFWVMQMIDSTKAARINVRKGMETANFVQLLSPHFDTSALILVSGNYGLPDTANVTIVNE